ncbi:MAG: DUF488 family protein [Desulfobacterales bacterium]|nr:DUF488 family protein [Desulfobacterales bacterium]
MNTHAILTVSKGGEGKYEMLKESYIANWKNLPADAVKVRVARPSLLAPPSFLLYNYKDAEKYFLECEGCSKMEARKRAWEAVAFEEIFRKYILSHGRSIEKLKALAELAKEKDVYLICFEKDWPCHRFILLDMAKKL